MNTRYEEAFHMFVDEAKLDGNVQGILFFGSAQRGQENETSDLDFYVIVAEDIGWNFKKYYNNVLIEAYYYPLKLWKKLIYESANIMHAFASGAIVYSISSEISELIELAISRYNKGPEQLTPIQKNNWRIELTELLLDIEGRMDSETNNIIWGGWSIIKVLEGYCALNRIWLVKPSNLEKWVSEQDKDMKLLLELYKFQPDLINLKSIIECVLIKHGGRILEYEGPKEIFIL
ncbi:hypothetical protein [Paenibacillus qinlingensis]|uniref:Nucleotidyltransferase n=1 Tax=Paenibacillus qinlingensis TaxID=1837343 RepID=A0ABU1P847_9BACL|nr:hypothetical protein [Paenibacillus qinlingensis]MDR6555501.1 putative nucleotidyltransferase [Paenibacillus qinlingensis]